MAGVYLFQERSFDSELGSASKAFGSLEGRLVRVSAGKGQTPFQTELSTWGRGSEEFSPLKDEL